MVIEKYNKEIEETIKVLKSIKSLFFSSINIYGSALDEKIFKTGYSDIDMILMSDNFKDLDLEKIVADISKLNADFKEKRPMIVDDYLCKRIEFYLKYKDIAIDITIAPALIPSYESLEKNVWYDTFEALMGGVYERSISLYGKIPDYDKFIKEFYPFYSDDLRIKRLDILANRILATNKSILEDVKNKNLDAVDHIYKIRKHFLMFLYIYYRKYFLSPEKHIYYQLENILNLSTEEKNILCHNKGNVFDSSREFLEMSNDYINRYYNDKKNLIKEKK